MLGTQITDTVMAMAGIPVGVPGELLTPTALKDMVVERGILLLAYEGKRKEEDRERKRCIHLLVIQPLKLTAAYADIKTLVKILTMTEFTINGIAAEENKLEPSSGLSVGGSIAVSTGISPMLIPQYF